MLPNNDTQPEFGEALSDAAAAGVKIAYYSCRVEADRIGIIGISEAGQSGIICAPEDTRLNGREKA